MTFIRCPSCHAMATVAARTWTACPWVDCGTWHYWEPRTRRESDR